MTATALHRSMAAAIAAFAVLLAGCYPARWTTAYSDVNPLSDVMGEDAIIEQSANDSEVEARNIERLRRISEEEDSVYRMNAGDQIEIRVYGHDDLGTITKLGPDGKIGIVFMGDVTLAGLTIAEAADRIKTGLSPYIKHPVVSVSVREVSSERATISGACKNPGTYDIANGTRLADFYAMAGSSATHLIHGTDTDVADLDHSMYVRNGEMLPVDFSKAITKADPLHNIKVRKGDYVFIAQRMESSITICGEVPRPQRRLYEPGMGIVELLTEAGWMLDTHWSHVIVIRDGFVNPKMYKIDIDGILAGRCRNVLLKPGDILYVPKDTLSEYNVFVKKLIPTAQLVNLSRSSISSNTIVQ